MFIYPNMSKSQTLLFFYKHCGKFGKSFCISECDMESVVLEVFILCDCYMFALQSLWQPNIFC